MKRIKELDEKELKNKKIKSKVKKTILGITIGSFIISLTPNIKYRIALNKAKKNSEITRLLEDKDNREKNIKTIYEMAINSNSNMSDENKKLFIDSFEEEFIIPYHDIILDETVYNMYAVASTQKVKEIDENVLNHAWWSGDYNSYFNTIYIAPYDDHTLIAHEQLHGILKTGLYDTGYTNGLNGYGINEALTVSLIKNDNSYFDEYLLSDYMGLIIGYDKVYNYYLNSDLSSLKKELNQYLSKEDTEKLISSIDMQVYSRYGLDFMVRNNIGSKSDKDDKFIIISQEQVDDYKNKKRIESKELMKKLFEAKYKCKPEESNLGRIIFGKDNDLFDENWDPEEPLYDVLFYDTKHVRIVVQKFGFGDDENYYKEYIVETEEIENIDIDALLDEAKSNIKHH